MYVPTLSDSHNFLNIYNSSVYRCCCTHHIIAPNRASLQQTREVGLADEILTDFLPKLVLQIVSRVRAPRAPRDLA